MPEEEAQCLSSKAMPESTMLMTAVDADAAVAAGADAAAGLVQLTMPMMVQLMQLMC